MTTQSPPPPLVGGSGPSAGASVGIAVGVVVGTVVLALLLCICLRKRKTTCCRRHRSRQADLAGQDVDGGLDMVNNPAFVSHQPYTAPMTSPLFEQSRPWLHERCWAEGDAELLFAAWSMADGTFFVFPSQPGAFTKHTLSYALGGTIHHVHLEGTDSRVCMEGVRVPAGIRSLDGLMVALQSQPLFGVKTRLINHIPERPPQQPEPDVELRPRPLTRQPRSYSEVMAAGVPILNTWNLGEEDADMDVPRTMTLDSDLDVDHARHRNESVL